MIDSGLPKIERSIHIIWIYLYFLLSDYLNIYIVFKIYFDFITPLKNPSRRGNTKPGAEVPKALKLLALTLRSYGMDFLGGLWWYNNMQYLKAPTDSDCFLCNFSLITYCSMIALIDH